MSCKVYLDNYTGTYTAGDTIHGRLNVQFNNEKNIRGIKIRLKCKEHTEWTERESHYNSNTKKHESRYVTYTGNHDIINQEIRVRGEGRISAGSHTFQFSFNLPNHIPSTFNGSYGTIHYYIKGLVDRPYKFDYEDRVFITVYSPINFQNMSEDLQKAHQTAGEKTICCFCCAHGPITFEMYLQKYAFVVGEIINLRLKVLNMSNVSIENITVKLKQKMISKVTSPSSKQKQDEEYINSLKHSGVGAHGDHDFTVRMEIPRHTQIPNFAACKLFSSSYKLQATCEIEGCHSDLDIELYPTIGHIQHERSVVQAGDWEDLDVTTTIGEDINLPPPYAPPANNIGFVHPPSNGNSFPQIPQNAYSPMPMPMPMPGGSSNYGPSAPQGNPEKPVFEGGPPSAPFTSADPNHPSAPELPPPSYGELKIEKPPI